MLNMETKTLAERSRRMRQESIDNMRQRNKKFWFGRQAEEMAARCRQIKEQATERLPELVKLAQEKLRDKGFHVHLAQDKNEAAEIITKLLEDARVVCKGKTIVGREVGVTSLLEGQGIKVVETDLGDRILQLLGGEASHQHHPSVHFSLEEIAACLAGEKGEQVEAKPELLAEAITKQLHQQILGADWAVVGCNSLAALEGAVFTVENEGNLRWVTTVPANLLVVTSIDKIVPSYLDATEVCYFTGYFAMSQVTTYIDMIAGPSKSADIQMKFIKGIHGPKNVHLVLLDNGRSNCIQAGLGEILYCINCSACLDICPVYYREGEKFSAIHALARGLMFTHFHQGLSKADAEALELCTKCGLCTRVCPARIDTPALLEKFTQLMKEMS
jgi:L-lactate utilization protein LutB